MGRDFDLKDQSLAEFAAHHYSGSLFSSASWTPCLFFSDIQMDTLPFTLPALSWHPESSCFLWLPSCISGKVLKILNPNSACTIAMMDEAFKNCWLQPLPNINFLPGRWPEAFWPHSFPSILTIENMYFLFLVALPYTECCVFRVIQLITLGYIHSFTQKCT